MGTDDAAGSPPRVATALIAVFNSDANTILGIGESTIPPMAAALRVRLGLVGNVVHDISHTERSNSEPKERPSCPSTMMPGLAVARH